jgi:hypothetical protein
MKRAIAFVLIFGLLTCHAHADQKDVPVKGSPLAPMFTSGFRHLLVDPSSVKRDADGFTIIVLDEYTKRAHEMGLVPNEEAASSGRLHVNCSSGTYEILTDFKLDASHRIIGEVGDAGESGTVSANRVIGEIAGLMCKPET